ncbi:GNAT family N-acetyltransferase, partial [Wenyingzhuangia sp. 2_MG-2023]|nr:GNAT family N-acetyltransferase [Wenyingzhuangia sp. 2_MG-2023]
MSLKINYRSANINDSEKLTKLFDSYRVFYKKESDIENAQKFLSERLTNNDSKIFVAENSEKLLLGFVQLY